MNRHVDVSVSPDGIQPSLPDPRRAAASGSGVEKRPRVHWPELAEDRILKVPVPGPRSSLAPTCLRPFSIHPSSPPPWPARARRCAATPRLGRSGAE